MDKKLGETINQCVEKMNSKRQVMGKLAWSRGKKFDMHVILNITRDTVTTNGEGQILFENCQNRK